MRKIHAAGYAQDEWKATPALTVNYGMRYSYSSPFTEVHYLGHANSHWLNPAAFSLPAAGAWGDAGRNLAVGPALWQDDSAVEKTFQVEGETHVIYRAESFNI